MQGVNCMKFLVVSDIHGSKKYAEKCIELFKSTEAEQMIVLGDFLYHGPRNPLPEEYDPKKVAELFNQYQDKIIGVRGNCDGEVDQMMLEFDMLADHALIINEGRKIFATHGHVYSPEHLPQLHPQDVFLYGHVHLPIAEEKEGLYILNPGSITLPKQNNPHSYGLLDENGFKIYTIDGTLMKQIEFKK